MAAGGGETPWVKILITGGVLIAVAYGLHHARIGPTWLYAALLALGGLGVVFGSCESMIVCVERIAARAHWNTFVAGAIAGLASNVPEVVMLGFVIAKEPQVGFTVVALTLHTGALAFGIYSALLPHDETGHARLPEPLVKLSTDLYVCAAAIFLATGGLMVMLREFTPGAGNPPGLTARDLYVLSALLLGVQTVAVMRLVRRFSGGGDATEEAPKEGDDLATELLSTAPPAAARRQETQSTGAIFGYGFLGMVSSVIGGHAVGEFADLLVAGLTHAGFSKMFGALLLSIFACAGAVAMISAAHAKKMYDIALANVSGWVTQMPFLVLPIALIQIAIFSHLGIIPQLPEGGVLPVNLQITSVFFLAFPPLLILSKAIQDDGQVNWVETATMIAVFVLTIYFLTLRG